MKTPFFILSGASGAGKTTHALAMLADFPQVHRIATYTTRSPRDSEQNGVDYVFINHEQFAELEENGQFIETNHYGDKWYGTHVDMLNRLNNGQPCLVVPDINGAIKMVKAVPHATLIWLTTDEETLRERLAGRGSERDDAIEKRLKIAREENKQAADTGLYEHVIDTSDFETAYKKIKAIFVSQLDFPKNTVNISI